MAFIKLMVLEEMSFKTKPSEMIFNTKLIGRIEKTERNPRVEYFKNGFNNNPEHYNVYDLTFENISKLINIKHIDFDPLD
ncbi:hypothetical protein ACTS93_15260 [Empedobacter falsenii]